MTWGNILGRPCHLNHLHNVELERVFSSRSLSPYHDGRLRRRLELYLASKKDSKKHAKQKSFKEWSFPFHRLPCEMIAEIFVLCLPDSEDYFNPIKSKHTAPLLLCNVSSSWRSLALSIPSLWNELCITIERPQVDINLATAMADSWIARSGELPLTLHLHVNPWNNRKQAEAMVKAYLNTFFRYASRWEFVDLALSDCSTVSFPKFGPIPLLREFSYTTSCPVSVPFPFTSCPLLSNLTWPFSFFIGSKRDPDIPWHQLIHITLELIMSTHQILHILRTCQTLVQFNVEIFEDPSLDRIRSRRKPVENRSLRTFHICVYHTCSSLLQSLTLPALTDLSLDRDYDSLGSTLPRSVHPQLFRLFTRSRCKLKRLRLGNCGFNDASLLKCLQHDSCSSLTELDIGNDRNQPMFTDKVILSLIDKDGLSESKAKANNVLLPNLTDLSLEMCLSASPGLLGLMVLTRYLWWDEDDRLTSLTLIDDLDDMDSTFINFAEEIGLFVHIQHIDSEESDFTADQYDTDDSYAI